MIKKYITKSYRQTQKLGEKLAKEFLALRRNQGENSHAAVFGLSGNLGGGKTTFLQGFAKGFGVKNKILSPTFVIMKKFQIPPIPKNRRPSDLWYKHFYHFDCYRFDKPGDILELGWKAIISNPKNIVAVEWPGKIKKVLPKSTIFINFKFINTKTREIRLT